ncbi:hypothetical protein FLP41_02855 (plasmid) [Paracoccus marcusii]|nr:hypothetical protein FLP41_02855 [Paracoccus marcusii]
MVDGQTGWLIPAGSEDDLAKALDTAARTHETNWNGWAPPPHARADAP